MPCLEDLRLMAYLHGGFPLVDEPYAAVAQALGTTEQDVLQRLHQGLLVDGTLVTADEAQWVLRRLAELLGWPQPG